MQRGTHNDFASGIDLFGTRHGLRSAPVARQGGLSRSHGRCPHTVVVLQTVVVPQTVAVPQTVIVTDSPPPTPEATATLEVTPEPTPAPEQQQMAEILAVELQDMTMLPVNYDAGRYSERIQFTLVYENNGEKEIHSRFQPECVHLVICSRDHRSA